LLVIAHFGKLWHLQAAIICISYALLVNWFDYVVPALEYNFRYIGCIDTLLWLASVAVDPLIYLTLNRCASNPFYLLTPLCSTLKTRVMKILKIRNRTIENGNKTTKKTTNNTQK
jgi:hypothetical protein